MQVNMTNLYKYWQVNTDKKERNQEKSKRDLGQNIKAQRLVSSDNKNDLYNSYVARFCHCHNYFHNCQCPSKKSMNLLSLYLTTSNFAFLSLTKIHFNVLLDSSTGLFYSSCYYSDQVSATKFTTISKAMEQLLKMMPKAAL